MSLKRLKSSERWNYNKKCRMNLREGSLRRRNVVFKWSARDKFKRNFYNSNNRKMRRKDVDRTKKEGDNDMKKSRGSLLKKLNVRDNSESKRNVAKRRRDRELNTLKCLNNKKRKGLELNRKLKCVKKNKNCNKSMRSNKGAKLSTFASNVKSRNKKKSF